MRSDARKHRSSRESLNPLVSRSAFRIGPAIPISGRKVGSVRSQTFVQQECHTTVGFGTHDFDAALGFVPIADDHVFQLFVQERFAGFFPGRVEDFDEIRQHSGGFEAVHLAVFDGGKETLYADSVVYAVRKDFVE